MPPPLREALRDELHVAFEIHEADILALADQILR
jgi:hypothetical protein